MNPTSATLRTVTIHMPVLKPTSLEAPVPTTPAGGEAACEPGAPLLEGVPMASCGGGMSLAGALRILVLGSGLAAQTDGAKSLNLLEGLVRQMREAGARKMLYAEIHNQVGNDDWLLQGLKGAMSATIAGQDADAQGEWAPVTFHRELNFMPGDPNAAKAEDSLTSTPKNAQSVRHVLDDTGHPQDSMKVRQELVQLIMRPELTFKMMNWFQPGRRDIARLVNDTSFVHSVLGAQHLLARFTSVRNTVAFEWLGPVALKGQAPGPFTEHLPEVLGEATFSKDREAARAIQRDLFSVFDRARGRDRDGAHTVLLVSDAMLAYTQESLKAADIDMTMAEITDRFVGFQNARGLSVVKLPFNRGKNTTWMVIPPALLPTAQDYAQEHPNLVKLHVAAPPRQTAKGPANKARNEL